VGAPQPGSQLLFESSRYRPAAGRQRTDHHSLIGSEIGKNCPRYVAKTSGHPVALDGVADGFRDNQTDPRPISGLGVAPCVHDDVRLRRSYTVLDGGAELRRPCHPELSREHAA